MDIHIELQDTDARFSLFASSTYELAFGGLSVHMNADQFQQLCDNLRPWVVEDTTPQPSADAVRAIGWLNSDGSSYLPTEKRARMIEAGKREGASVGEVTFGKIAEDHRIALYAAPPSVAGLVTAWRDRINVDPEDPYEHGESDTLMSCADELESLLSAASGEKGVGK